MLRLPYENYVRFLITCGLDYDNAVITLKELELHNCSSEYWNAQFDLLHEVPLPNKIQKYWADPKKKRPNRYVEHMGAVGLTEIWKHKDGLDHDFDVVLDMANDPDIRIIVEALLLRRTEKDEIAALLQARFNLIVRPATLAVYEKYFFQVTIMSRASWREYLKSLEGISRKVYYLGLAGKELQMRSELGLPNRISVSEHYQQLHISSLERFKTLMNSDAPGADAMAIKWAQIAMSAGDKYEKLKLGDSADFGKDLQMEFDYIDTDFPGIGESDLVQIQNSIDTGEAKDHHEPIPLTENPIKQMAD